ncbi:hypothetical protein H4217_002692 [Coemansia sp. RSA 1939]|nr:hypothetical protein H4217_002692 [Coemansia sp. RSA 1939]KAJ2614075.1 hypothetical protein EV177_002236 [Coemansia sp. RSA 1804]
MKAFMTNLVALVAVAAFAVSAAPVNEVTVTTDPAAAESGGAYPSPPPLEGESGASWAPHWSHHSGESGEHPHHSWGSEDFSDFEKHSGFPGPHHGDFDCSEFESDSAGYGEEDAEVSGDAHEYASGTWSHSGRRRPKGCRPHMSGAPPEKPTGADADGAAVPTAAAAT